MSYEKTLENIDRIEAITNYKDLKKRHQETNELLKQETMRRKKAEKENEKLRSIQVKFAGGAHALENLEEAVKKEAEKKYQEYKKTHQEREDQKRWEENREQLTRQELIRTLQYYPKIKAEHRNLLEKWITFQTNNILKDPSKWPKWFTETFNQKVETQVKEGLDQVFDIRVGEKAKTEIDRLTRIEWPRFVEGYITDRLHAEIIDQLRVLTTDVIIACDWCGREYQVIVSPDNMAALLLGNYVFYECKNPQCKTRVGRHRISINLGNLLEALMIRDEAHPLKKQYTAKVLGIYKSNDEQQENPDETS
jgi:hypothetical protein